MLEASPQSPEKQKNTFKNLIVYQKTLDLIEQVYKKSSNFPKSDFALKHQIQKAAISIAGNIAEGQDRFSDKESIRFLHIARASLAEVETYVDIASRLNYLEENEVILLTNLIDEIGRMINGLIKYLREKS